jgi:hypothetical protein
LAALNIGAYNLVIDGCTVTSGGTLTTTGTITLANGGVFVGARTDSTGTVTSATLTVAGMIAGSRILLRRTDNQAVLANQTVAGTTFTYAYNHTINIPVEVVVRKATGSPAYQEWRTTATLVAAGVSLTANQQLDE